MPRRERRETTSRADAGPAAEPDTRPPAADTPPPLELGGLTVGPGERRQLEIPVARLPATQSYITLPVEALHGERPGPRVWLSAAIHGDELNGVEIIRQVLSEVTPERLKGSLLAVPIVNVFGLINQSRYLPDRRDLNRSFPGSSRGSLAARLAHIFMQEIVRRCTHGIDLHTGSDHRTNLPQIRGNLFDAETRRCARAFGAPVMIHAETRDGSLRDAASRLGIPTLLYEAGEPLRFDDQAIEVGVAGTLRVLGALGMIETGVPPVRERERPIVATRTSWVRARSSGICRLQVRLGEWVRKKQRLAVISDSFGETNVSVSSPTKGLVIGHSRNPLVRQGDGLFHLAVEFEEGSAVPP